MTILSIDVGIKNLAYCLLDDQVIHKWGVLSLVNNEKHICCAKIKGGKSINKNARALLITDRCPSYVGLVSIFLRPYIWMILIPDSATISSKKCTVLSINV